MKTPKLPRHDLMGIGHMLRELLETAVVKRNPKLEMLLLIAAAKLRIDSFLKGSKGGHHATSDD